MLLVALFGYFVLRAYADGRADVVLSCVLVDVGGAQGGGMGRGGFSRTPATLVLRDVPTNSDQALDTLSPFVLPSAPNPDFLIFETRVSPDVPNLDVLLHADCEGLEVTCELSRFSPAESPQSSEQAFFMVLVNVEGESFSASLILKSLTAEHSTLRQSILGLPLTSAGTVNSETVMVVFSHESSVSGSLREEVQLPCGFRQQDLGQSDVLISWRVQHRGQGRRVLEMKTRLQDTQGTAVIQAERGGASVREEQVSEGNASLTLRALTVEDEGTYICSITIGPLHAQQVIQLSVIKLPEVSLSVDRLVLKSQTTLVCYSSKFFPLDAEIQWFTRGPADSEPVEFSGKTSLSGHRRHGDGTYSISSQLNVPPTISVGTVIICRVSHPALDAPLSISVTVESPESASYWGVLGFLLITGLFFFQVMK
ncbi:unnamed protein product [Knipowitschia caucasica]